jgi:hypothetical protein
MQRRETIIRRVEFDVPVAQGFGTTHVELNKAIQVAANEYWQATGTAQGGPLPDDAIRLSTSDGVITVFFELEKRQ